MPEGGWANLAGIAMHPSPCCDMGCGNHRCPGYQLPIPEYLMEWRISMGHTAGETGSCGSIANVTLGFAVFVAEDHHNRAERDKILDYSYVDKVTLDVTCLQTGVLWILESSGWHLPEEGIIMLVPDGRMILDSVWALPENRRRTNVAIQGPKFFRYARRSMFDIHQI